MPSFWLEMQNRSVSSQVNSARHFIEIYYHCKLDTKEQKLREHEMSSTRQHYHGTNCHVSRCFSSRHEQRGVLCVSRWRRFHLGESGRPKPSIRLHCIDRTGFLRLKLRYNHKYTAAVLSHRWRSRSCRTLLPGRCSQFSLSLFLTFSLFLSHLLSQFTKLLDS